MPNPQMRCPQHPAKTLRATKENKHVHGTATWLIREAVATVSIGLLVSVVMWSCILGMSTGFQPGQGVVVGPIAENDHGR